MFETQTIPEAHSIVLLRRIFKIVVSAYLVIGMISAYRAFYQVRSLDIQSPDVLQSGSAITTNVVSYARGAVDVRVELVQDDHVGTIATFRVHGNEWALFDPRTQHGSQTTTLTDDVLKQLQRAKRSCGLLRPDVRSGAVCRRRWFVKASSTSLPPRRRRSRVARRRHQCRKIRSRASSV